MEGFLVCSVHSGSTRSNTVKEEENETIHEYSWNCV